MIDFSKRPTIDYLKMLVYDLDSTLKEACEKIAKLQTEIFEKDAKIEALESRNKKLSFLPIGRN